LQYWGGNVKSKTTAKLIEKRTSIAAFLAKLGQIDTVLRLYDMNGIFEMQGGKNRILPK
jgi:hypothetical protein